MLQLPATHWQNTIFTKCFINLEDPRRTTKGNFKHLLTDVLFLTVSAVLCGAGDWEAVELFGNNQLDWLKKYGAFTSGVPSSDTINRIFSSFNPKAFNACFMNWVSNIADKTKGEVIAIDGKSIRGANPKGKGSKMPHIVSAFASENGLCLGQVKVNDKSNEITAIPELLELLSIEDSIVTIDAMGCQTDIAEKIIKAKADYLLAVKGNQSNLEQAIVDTIRFEKPACVDRHEDFGHGRIESRTCSVYNELSHVDNIKKWKKLTTIIKIESEIYYKSSGQTSTEERFYISSLPADAKKINYSVRKHWSVENNLHWTLDVEFGEDRSRKRNGNVAENFNIVLKTALVMLTKETSLKKSKKNKRLKAALDSKYRDKIFQS